MFDSVTMRAKSDEVIVCLCAAIPFELNVVDMESFAVKAAFLTGVVVPSDNSLTSLKPRASSIKTCRRSDIKFLRINFTLTATKLPPAIPSLDCRRTFPKFLSALNALAKDPIACRPIFAI